MIVVGLYTRVRTRRCRAESRKKMKWLSAGSQWIANIGDRFDEGACRVLKLPSSTSTTTRGRVAPKIEPLVDSEEVK